MPWIGKLKPYLGRPDLFRHASLFVPDTSEMGIDVTDHGCIDLCRCIGGEDLRLLPNLYKGELIFIDLSIHPYLGVVNDFKEETPRLDPHPLDHHLLGYNPMDIGVDGHGLFDKAVSLKPLDLII